MTWILIGRILLALCAAFTAAALCFGGWIIVHLVAGTRLKIDEEKPFQAMKGFGVSGAWWAQNAGGSEALIDGEPYAEYMARMLYDKETGIGLSMYRYNIGAGSIDNPDSLIDNPWQKAESFYVYDKETKTGVYDFTRDAGAMKVLDLAVRKYGVKEIILFANSPHYSMTKSGLASGMRDGSSNLAEENYAAYADYLLTITEHFLDEGYPVTALSPINEPFWDWGNTEKGVWQEGCHYEPDEVIAFFRLLVAKMEKNEKFKGVKLCFMEAPDFNKDKKAYLKELKHNAALNEKADNTYYSHTYGYDGGPFWKWWFRWQFDLRMNGAKLAMTEWCDHPCRVDFRGIQSGLNLAKVMQDDIRYLKAVSWEAWTALSGYGHYYGELRGDGLFAFAGEDSSDAAPSKRYYALGHFSKFIAPGDKRIGVKFSNKIKTWGVPATAYRTSRGVVAVIANNSGRRVGVTMPEGYTDVTMYKTDDTRSLDLYYSGKIADYNFQNRNAKNELVPEIDIDAKAIYTLILQ
jgi:O-glycosyl hydrolase